MLNTTSTARTRITGQAAQHVRSIRLQVQEAKANLAAGNDMYGTAASRIESGERYLRECREAAAWIVGVNYSVLHAVGGCSLRRNSNHICAPISESQAEKLIANGARRCGRCS
jgi:hypothetical protein